MQIIDKKLTDLIPYENNPRQNDSAVESVMASIEEFGFKVPIVINTEGVIITGHTRYRASKRLDLDTVPCIIANDLTEEQIKAFRIMDNKSSEFAEWDIEKLLVELDELELMDYDTDLTGYELSDIKDLRKELDGLYNDIDTEPLGDTIGDKDLSDSVEATYEVIISCANELEQENLYNKLNSEGYTVRVLTI